MMDGMYGWDRLSDADRAAAVADLDTHAAAGRLTAREVGERSLAVRAARTRADLGRVFADLPEDQPVRRALRDRHWRTHAALFALVTTAMLGLWLLVRDPDPLPRDYGPDYWWPLWVALAWATLLLLHLLRVAGLLRRARQPLFVQSVRSEQSKRSDQSDRSDRSERPERSEQPERSVRSERPGPSERTERTEPSGARNGEPQAGAPGLLARLTARERDVLALVGQGRANKDIAAALYISERTARTHVSNILRKLELTSRTQAALLANRSGVIRSQDA